MISEGKVSNKNKQKSELDININQDINLFGSYSYCYHNKGNNTNESFKDSVNSKGINKESFSHLKDLCSKLNQIHRIKHILTPSVKIVGNTGLLTSVLFNSNSGEKSSRIKLKNKFDKNNVFSMNKFNTIVASLVSQEIEDNFFFLNSNVNYNESSNTNTNTNENDKLYSKDESSSSDSNSSGTSSSDGTSSSGTSSSSSSSSDSSDGSSSGN